MCATSFSFSHRLSSRSTFEAKLNETSTENGFVNGDLHIHVANVATPEGLDCAHRVGVWEAGIIQPALVVESDRFDHQRVFYPLARGITIPGWEHRPGSAATIGVDLPEMAEFLIKDEHERRCL